MNRFLDMLYVVHGRSWSEIIGVPGSSDSRSIDYMPGDNFFYLNEDGVHRTFTIVDSMNDLRIGDMVDVTEIAYSDGRLFMVLKSVEATICGECIGVATDCTPTHLAVKKDLAELMQPDVA